MGVAHHWRVKLKVRMCFPEVTHEGRQVFAWGENDVNSKRETRLEDSKDSGVQSISFKIHLLFMYYILSPVLCTEEGAESLQRCIVH